MKHFNHRREPSGEISTNTINIIELGTRIAMAYLKLRIKLNEGHTGVPLGKLGDVTHQFVKFLESIATDLGVELKQNTWLATNFHNGSVLFDAVYQEEVPESVAREFNNCLEFVTDYDPNNCSTEIPVTEATLLEYGKFANCLDPGEEFKLGTFPMDDSKQQVKWHRIESRIVSQVQKAKEMPLSSYGSVQGGLHSLFKEAPNPYFKLRELSSKQLIQCSYKPALYPSVINGLKDGNAIIHATGYLQHDRATQTVTKMRVERIDKIEPLTEREFSVLFGMDPNFS